MVQKGNWTVGVLVNHLWSFARVDWRTLQVNNTFINPFISYSLGQGWTATVQSEMNRNWNKNAFTMNVQGGIAKVIQVNKHAINLSLQARYWVKTTPSGPHGWGARFVVALVLPK